MCCRKKTAAAIEISPQLFCAGGKMDTQEKKAVVPNAKETALLSCSEVLDTERCA